MSELFKRCVEVILRNEGGYINHPSDPGGETNFGISKRAFPTEDIKNMTRERAIEIYYQHFWLRLNIGQLPDHLALQVFDFAVNAGSRIAAIALQKIVVVKADGVIGPVTLNAVRALTDEPYKAYRIIDKYMTARKLYYAELVANKNSLVVFLRGWLNRVNHTMFILLCLVLLSSCNPAKYCAKRFPPTTTTDTITTTLTEYRDTIIYITLEPETIYKETPVYIYITEEGEPAATSDTVTASTYYATAWAWVGGGRLSLKLQNRDNNIMVTIDSALKVINNTEQIIVTNVTKVPVVSEFCRWRYFALILLTLASIIFIVKVLFK